jgi:hypothetical protein
MSTVKTKRATKAKSETAPVEAPTITAFKGFNSKFQCAPNGKPFQYEVGKAYTMDGAVEVCSRGFHACLDPLDVWGYYGIIGKDGEPSRFAEVELSGATDKASDGDSKIAAASITIKAELSLPDFIKRAVNRIIELTKGAPGVTAASGHSSQLAASGHYSQLAASGDSSKLAASGHYSQLAASGDSSVIATTGPNSRAKGADGTWIAVAEYDSGGKCVGFATGSIGKDGLRSDTWYRAENGKLTAA